MKMLYHTASVIGHRIVHIAEDEKYGILLVAETGALPEFCGMDYGAKVVVM